MVNQPKSKHIKYIPVTCIIHGNYLLNFFFSKPPMVISGKIPLSLLLLKSINYSTAFSHLIVFIEIRSAQLIWKMITFRFWDNKNGKYLALFSLFSNLVRVVMSTVDFFSQLDDIKRHDILHDTARQYSGHVNDSPHPCQHGNHKNCCESLINTQFYRWLRAYRKCYSFSADAWHFGMRTALLSAFKLYVVQFWEQKKWNVWIEQRNSWCWQDHRQNHFVSQERIFVSSAVEY